MTSVHTNKTQATQNVFKLRTRRYVCYSMWHSRRWTWFIVSLFRLSTISFTCSRSAEGNFLTWTYSVSRQFRGNHAAFFRNDDFRFPLGVARHNSNLSQKRPGVCYELLSLFMIFFCCPCAHGFFNPSCHPINLATNNASAEQSQDALGATVRWSIVVCLHRWPICVAFRSVPLRRHTRHKERQSEAFERHTITTKDLCSTRESAQRPVFSKASWHKVTEIEHSVARTGLSIWLTNGNCDHPAMPCDSSFFEIRPDWTHFSM
jgi:hypothetical protein